MDSIDCFDPSSHFWENGFVVNVDVSDLVVGNCEGLRGTRVKDFRAEFVS